MLVNRSVPSATIIPVLAYNDVAQAANWLCDVFGFTERLRIGNHRAQLIFGDGAVIITGRDASEEPATPRASHSLHVRIEDADNHYAHAVQRGAHILQPPTDYPYGERQYVVEDLGGHRWTFSQSLADVDPTSWGAPLSNTI